MKSFSKFVIFFLGICIYGQSPDWSVNTNLYQYSMTFTVFLNVNGTTLTNSNDKVGAFVNNENRGEAFVAYNASSKKYVAYLSVLSNTPGETITFKIYDSTNDIIVDAIQTETFVIDKNVGGIFQSYSIANPLLADDAAINSFSIKGISAQTTISTNQININVSNSTSISDLIPEFTTVNNGSVFVNNVNQTSGANTVNFTNPVIYQVLSEDESIIKEYVVTVNRQSNSTPISVNLTTVKSITNEQPLSVSLITSEAISGLSKDDFFIENGIVNSINTTNNIDFNVEVVSFSEGTVTLKLPREKVLNADNQSNLDSNTLEVTIDTFKPYIKSIERKNPSAENTSGNEVVFEITFNEDVVNVDTADFLSVTNATLSISKIDDTVYTITVTNLQNHKGTVYINLASNNNIKDLAGNELQFLKIASYEK